MQCQIVYLGVKIDTSISWQYYVNDLSIKLERANAFLFKMQKHVRFKTLRSVLLFLIPIYPLLSLSGLRIVTIQQILILQKRCELIIFDQGIPAPFQNFKIKLAWKIFCLSADLSIIYHYRNLGQHSILARKGTFL